jgi:hypothetical protein
MAHSQLTQSATVAYHESLYLIDESTSQVLESWPVDLRGW